MLARIFTLYFAIRIACWIAIAVAASKLELIPTVALYLSVFVLTMLERHPTLTAETTTDTEEKDNEP